MSILGVDQFRWPKEGDRLLRKVRGGVNQTRFEAHGETRHHFIWDGNMRAADLLVASCENDRYESATLVYPILYNYRHGIELALKWIIMKFGEYVLVEVGDYQHHNLWKLWRVYKEIVLELGSDDGNTFAVVEQVVKDFHDLDKSGQAFRYADARNGTFELPDYPIDLQNTREVMKGNRQLLFGSLRTVGRQCFSGGSDRLHGLVVADQDAAGPEALAMWPGRGCDVSRGNRIGAALRPREHQPG